ncbi:hypothetical protein [Sporichthya polymorpha]|uniref:hypothetical protein n=1 Tax=Sporichthya polymorpha TaxID=35751 RepID=UPI0003629461|nr:hypothetical protein [Sporichthya polymorpha]
MYAVYAGIAGLGAVLFVVGTSLVSSETLYDDQVPGINLAIVGVVLANAAGALLLLAGRRAVLARRVRVLGAVPKVVEEVEVVTVVPAASGSLIAGEGLVHFHRADCVMASGRDWPAVDRSVHEGAGRIACGVCKP